MAKENEEKKRPGRPPNDSLKAEKPKHTIDPDLVGNRIVFETRSGIHLEGKILWMKSNWIVLQAEKGSSIKFEEGEDRVFLIHGNDMLLARIL